MFSEFCPLTGYKLEPNQIVPSNGVMKMEYLHPAVGHAVIADIALGMLQSVTPEVKAKIAGICRNAFENQEPVKPVTAAFIAHIDNTKTPSTLREKTAHLLRYMYDRGGKGYADFEFLSSKDYPLAYAKDEAEFFKIIKHLETKGFISIGQEIELSGHRINYENVVLTDSGIAEVEKELPVIPMLALAQKEIATGSPEVDEKINHARKLFFAEPQTMEHMRSACQTLTNVLEPWREQLKTAFSNDDVATFFRMVNEFDIRHNAERTRSMQYPEQLEWVFYTLLNSISTYVSLQKRLSI